MKRAPIWFIGNIVLAEIVLLDYERGKRVSAASITRAEAVFRSLYHSRGVTPSLCENLRTRKRGSNGFVK